MHFSKISEIMNRIFLILIVSTLVVSCKQQSPEEQLKNLSGYWEIKSVEFPNGEEKNYSISTTIDYIQIEDTVGIRKKAQPQLDGTFKVSENTETFTTKIEEDSLHLYYSTPYDNWKETVLYAKDSTLHILNKDKNIYKYKKFSTFNFND